MLETVAFMEVENGTDPELYMIVTKGDKIKLVSAKDKIITGGLMQ